MKRMVIGFAAILTGLSAAAYLGLHPTFGSEETDPKPPVARVVPKIFKEHGKQRVDNYYWLRESKNPEVIAYLEAENVYADAHLARLRLLIDEIHAEMKPRAIDVDLAPPFLDNGYYYQRRFERGKEYQVVVRRKDVPGAPEEIVFDVSALAAQYPQIHFNRWLASPDGAYVAYAVDLKGDNSNQILRSKDCNGRDH